MEIKLQTGRIVEIEAFKINKTYAGLLVGKPNKAINDKIIDSINYSSDLGNHKTLLKKKDMYVSKNILKPLIYSILLTSSGVPKESKVNDASSIVLLWFGEEPNDKSITDIIKEEIGSFDWDKHAENFQF